MCFLGNTRLFVTDVCSKTNGRRLQRSLTARQKRLSLSPFVRAFSLRSCFLEKLVLARLSKGVSSLKLLGKDSTSVFSFPWMRVNTNRTRAKERLRFFSGSVPPARREQHKQRRERRLLEALRNYTVRRAPRRAERDRGCSGRYLPWEPRQCAASSGFAFRAAALMKQKLSFMRTYRTRWFFFARKLASLGWGKAR